MKKNLNTLVILLLLVCTVLTCALYTIKMDSSQACQLEVNNVEDLKSSKSIETFDINNYDLKETNDIDIASKYYEKNKITVSDSSFQISKELSDNIYKMINEYGSATSFYIISLEDGMSIGYNVDKKFETASSIKAPYALYIYKEIAAGNIDPEQKLTYESRYYNEGTGVIKDAEFGTEYTVSELVYYSLSESDNIAHEMLHSNFGVRGYNDMLGQLGTDQLYLTASNPWGFISARSAALVWQEIYNFAIEESEGITFLNILSNGKYNYFKEVMPDIPSASKTGFASKDVVETGIVFGEHPYIGIAIANKGGDIGAYTQVLKIISSMNDIMNEYGEYLEQ